MCVNALATWQKTSTKRTQFGGASISSSVFPSTYSISSSAPWTLNWDSRFQPAIEDLGNRRMVQFLGRLEFGQGLLDINLIFRLLLADHLQGITLAAGRLVADQQDRAAVPVPSVLTTRYFMLENLGVLAAFVMPFLGSVFRIRIPFSGNTLMKRIH